VVGFSSGLRWVLGGENFQRLGFNNAHVLEHLFVSVRREGHAVHAVEQHVVVQPDQATHTHAPLGGYVEKQVYDGLVVGPQIERLALEVLGREAQGCQLFLAGFGLVEDLDGPLQFPRRPLVSSARYLSMMARAAPR
jgi:hypothetical protein